MILKPATRRVFERALATVDALEPDLRDMETVAKDVPHIAERVDGLIKRAEYLRRMCESCISIDRATDTSAR